jgi:hypothetical protein
VTGSYLLTKSSYAYWLIKNSYWLKNVSFMSFVLFMFLFVFLNTSRLFISLECLCEKFATFRTTLLGLSLTVCDLQYICLSVSAKKGNKFVRLNVLFRNIKQISANDAFWGNFVQKCQVWIM